MKKRLYVGVDESNHGRFPEIFVAVYSKLEKDIEVQEGLLEKRRNNQNPLKNLGKRSYSFLQVSKGDYERIAPKEFIGTVVTSLMQDKMDSSLPENLEIFLDGGRSTSQIIYTRDLISHTFSLPPDSIKIFTGSRFDQIYPLVNLADSIASHIFRNFSPKDISYNRYHKNILK